MTKKSPLKPYDYRAEMERTIQETRDAIQEALGYIDAQEDGPFVMRSVLHDIDNRLSAVETEVAYLVGTVDGFHETAKKLIQQRDEAIHQRDVLFALQRRPKRRDQ